MSYTEDQAAEILKRRPLSFRDQCAIAAMQGLISGGIGTQDGYIILDEKKLTITDAAFKIADDMDAERVKRRGAR